SGPARGGVWLRVPPRHGDLLRCDGGSGASHERGGGRAGAEPREELAPPGHTRSMRGDQPPETWIAVPTPHSDLPFRVSQGQTPDADARFAKGGPGGARDADPGRL